MSMRGCHHLVSHATARCGPRLNRAARDVTADGRLPWATAVTRDLSGVCYVDNVVFVKGWS
jgi:hypothetical protein